MFEYIINLIEGVSDASDTTTTSSKIEPTNQNMGSNIPNDPDFEKIKKILLTICFLLIGGFFLYFMISLYVPEIPPNFSIDGALEQLKEILPLERVDQISATIHEMEARPDKVKLGIQLLHIIKLVLKTSLPEGQQEQFVKIMDKIISYFEKEK